MNENEEIPTRRGFWTTVLIASAIGYIVFLIYGNVHKDGRILREVRPAFLFADAFLRTLISIVVGLIVALIAKLLHKATEKAFIVAFIIWAVLSMYSLWNTSPY